MHACCVSIMLNTNSICFLSKFHPPLYLLLPCTLPPLTHPSTPTLSLSLSLCLPLSFSLALTGERGSVQCASAGRDVERCGCGDALPVWEKLCAPGPCGTQRAGQLQPGVQGVWLWPVPPDEGSGPQHAHIHRFPGEFNHSYNSATVFACKIHWHCSSSTAKASCFVYIYSVSFLFQKSLLLKIIPHPKTSNVPAFPSFAFLTISPPGQQDSGQVDSSGGIPASEVQLSQWCLELWHPDVGGDVIWGEAVLGHEQPGGEGPARSGTGRCSIRDDSENKNKSLGSLRPLSIFHQNNKHPLNTLLSALAMST